MHLNNARNGKCTRCPIENTALFPLSLVLEEKFKNKNYVLFYFFNLLSKRQLSIKLTKYEYNIILLIETPCILLNSWREFHCCCVKFFCSSTNKEDKRTGILLWQPVHVFFFSSYLIKKTTISIETTKSVRHSNSTSRTMEIIFYILNCI